MKRKGFHAILQQQSNVRENRAQFGHEFLGFELMFVERIRARLGARFRVIDLVGRGDDEKTLRRHHPRAFLQKRAIVRKMLDHFEGDNQFETVGPKRRGDRRRTRGKEGWGVG